VHLSDRCQTHAIKPSPRAIIPDVRIVALTSALSHEHGECQLDIGKTRTKGSSDFLATAI
jgi:hypothetical protein